MDLPNNYFINFPIEFKKIHSSDFSTPTNKYEVKKKITIPVDENGYIGSLSEYIPLEDKETVILNAPVGCGKSYQTLKLVNQIYLTEPNSLIIIAVPFVSLVEQYVKDLQFVASIPQDFIYDYTDLGRHPKVPYAGKKVHIVTANSLLGNPGEDGFKNSEAKREYLRYLFETAETLGQKVYFIYDEIHDTISNFKEEFIFNLWNWKKVIHKNILISATFTEASKEVVKYLAELTDRKISILEVPRKRFPKKQSSLYLHYCSDFNFTNTTPKLVNVIDDLLGRGKSIDILCYSKTLAKNIINDKTGIGKKLREKLGNIQDCTSQIFSNQRQVNLPPGNRFNNDACNVGTNFKTGVNIVKKNHAYVIVLPPRSTRLPYRNLSGIFSDGITGVIQALARQRTKGEIHIILPKPDKFNFKSLENSGMDDEQIETFTQYYKKIESPESKSLVDYLPLDKQQEILHSFYYDVLMQEVRSSIKKVEMLNANGERDELPRLIFPTFELFKLNTGEDYLTTTFGFYGEDLSSYVTYSAFTNQFANCTLTHMNGSEALYFEEGKIIKNLFESFDKHWGYDFYSSILIYSNFSMFYTRLRKEFFNNYTLLLKGEEDKWTQIKPYQNLNFELQFLQFCLKLYEIEFSKLNDDNLKDVTITRGDYILSNIAYAQAHPDENELTKAYTYLGKLRQRLIDEIKTLKDGTQYLPIKPTENFITAIEMKDFHLAIETIITNDAFFKNSLFILKRNVEKKDSSKQLLSVYRVLLQDFFTETESTNYSKANINGKRKNVKTIATIKNLPKVNNSPIMNADFDETYEEAIEESIMSAYDQEGNKLFNTYQEYKDSVKDIIEKLNL